MTHMEEIVHKAYLTAKSFNTLAPPEGCLYIGSRISYGDRFRYWIAEDGTLYQESSGEASLKHKKAGGKAG